jgi:hypothetical protein
MTTLNLSLQPSVLRWARERAGLSSDYIAFYRDYEADERRHRDRKADGGSFWNSQNAPLGERFGAAVAHAVKEGRLLYRDAYRLTALRGDTFTKLAERILSASH